MVALAVYLNHTTYTEKLQVPDGLTPSDSTLRGWLIDWRSNSDDGVWVPLIALVPALLVYILMFMETHISEYVCCTLVLPDISKP